MPRFKIVIDNPQIAHEKEIERNVHANVRAHGVDRMGAMDAVRAINAINRTVRAMVGSPRAPGTVHDICDSECPDGLPNCRNCGDPEHEASCKAAGHCENCGRSTGAPDVLQPKDGKMGHGLSPDRIVALRGYRLELE